MLSTLTRIDDQLDVRLEKESTRIQSSISALSVTAASGIRIGYSLTG